VANRCWGLTRDLRFCQRLGEWRFFCGDHRRQPMTWLSFLVLSVGTAAVTYWPLLRKDEVWVRVTDVGDTAFSVSADEHSKVVMMNGRIVGTVSDSRRRVFLAVRAHIPIPRGPKTPGRDVKYETSKWRLSEAAVDALGNWSAYTCPYPLVHTGRPKTPFEYWEVSAISVTATTDIEGLIVKFDCSLSDTVLAGLRSAVCSDAIVKPRPADADDDGQAHYRDPFSAMPVVQRIC
jgi:hypothetical protein